MNWKKLLRAIKTISLERAMSIEQIVEKKILVLVGKAIALLMLCFSPTIIALLFLFFVRFDLLGLLWVFLSLPATGLWIKFIVSVLDKYEELENE